jgi:hypothetical protein
VNNKKSTKKLGRPKLPKGEAKGKIVPVRLNSEELKLFRRRQTPASTKHCQAGYAIVCGRWRQGKVVAKMREIRI